MPLNLTNTIHLVNIPPNLISFIYYSKLNNKMNEMFILGLHGIYYTEQAVQDVRPLQVRCAALKIQAKLQVLLQQCVVLLPQHRVSLQHQRESGQRGSQAAAVQNHNLKRKNSESEEDQKRKGHLPEPERGPQHHQEHQAEEAGGRGRVSESSASSSATSRQAHCYY